MTRKHRSTDAPLQKQFDWPRAWKLKLLDEMRLPDGPYLYESTGKPIHAGKSKMVLALRTLDALIGNDKTWRAKWETLAGRMGCSTAAVRRAVKALESLNVVALHRHKESGWRAYEFQIIWSNLSDYRPSAQIDHSECANCADRVRNVTTPSAQCDHSSIPPTSSAPLPDQLPAQGDGEFQTSLDGREANRIVDRISDVIPIRTDDDLSLVTKVARLRFDGAISENDLEVALSVASGSKKRIAGFQAKLNQLLGGGWALNDLLKTIPNVKKCKVR